MQYYGYPCEDTEIQGEGHMKTEAEIGVMLLQAKDHLELPVARRDREESHP